MAAAYAVKDLPRDHPLLLAAMQHHANWNGKGSYPQWYNPDTRRLVSLRGDMIHPYAQFFLCRRAAAAGKEKQEQQRSVYTN